MASSPVTAPSPGSPPSQTPPSNSSSSSPPPTPSSPPPSPSPPSPPPPTTSPPPANSPPPKSSPPSTPPSPPKSPPPKSPPPSSDDSPPSPPPPPPPNSSNNKSPPPPPSNKKSPPPPPNNNPSPSSPPPPPPPPPPKSSSSSGALSPPTHKTSPSSSSSHSKSSPPDNNSTTDKLPLIIGVTAGVGILLVIMIVIFASCKKKKRRPHDQMYYGDPSRGPKGGEYFNSSQHPNWHNSPQPMDHIVKMPPPPSGMGPPGGGGGGWPAPPPPPPIMSSSEMSSNFSGPHHPPLPPPSPSLALGFNKSTFTYDELAAATGGFSQANLLGQGGFGYVHKGVFPNGKEVAVKSLKSGSGQGEREFQAEVEIISRVHHRHLVSLVGYCIAAYPFTSFPLDSGAFPLILYFNQSVEGINLSTVSVESLFNGNKNLVWTSLSTSNTRSAQAWVTYLKFPDVRDYSVKSYPVRVRLGHSECITSTSGSYFCCPCEFAFTIVFRPIESEYTEGSPEMEMVVWKNNRFHTDDALLQEMSPTVVSFDQLAIKMEPKLTFSSWHVQTIEEEINCFRMLISLNDCKIGKLTLARLLMAHDAMMSYNLCCLGSGGTVQQDVHHTPFMQKDECSDTSKASINSCIKTPATFRSIHSEEVLELFSDLMRLDPSHYGYYKDEHSLVLLKQITSSRELLLRHCQYYGGSASLKARNSVCLRLNNLSLSQIGSIEHLLWVQMLDLSHNELQSIEGLGAMQLLSCLNLSNNKFSSFTSLEPLRLLKSLKVLDISYNEFGAHSIDTKRYLCSSPLSHTLGSDWIVDYESDSISVTDYWEALMIFRGLHLTQLDIVGNAVTGEKFKSLLVKILPKLRWLDGEDVQ